VDEAGERAKAVAKKGLAPKDSPGRRQAEEIRRQVEGQPDAERRAAHDTAKDFQEVGGDVAEAGSRVAATTAIEAAKVELGTRAVGLGAGTIREVVGKSIAAGDRTYVVYTIRNAEGQVVYVGRASGAGTPAEVLAARASSHEYRGVGTFRIEEAQATRAANRGAEDVIYQRERLKARDEGRTLLNKENPISPRNPRKRGYVDAYNEEAKQ
jgi:hypothetical protein